MPHLLHRHLKGAAVQLPRKSHPRVVGQRHRSSGFGTIRQLGPRSSTSVVRHPLAGGHPGFARPARAYFYSNDDAILDHNKGLRPNSSHLDGRRLRVHDEKVAHALLLDLGGTVFRHRLEQLIEYAEREPAVRETLARCGRLGTEPDELWEQVLRREIEEPEYLRQRAEEVGRALGQQWSVRDLIRTLITAPGGMEPRPTAADLVASARAAGRPVGALTNDAVAFGGDPERIRRLLGLDVLVDGSVIGALKPDPRAYVAAAERLGPAPEETVYLDDLPWNVEGAAAAGMTAFHVDLTEPARAFDAARVALRLG